MLEPHLPHLAPFTSAPHERQMYLSFVLPPAYQHQLEKNKKAFAFWQSQPQSYRRTATWWVISAKQDATRLKRLTTLITDSENHRRLAQLNRKPTSE